VSIRFLAASEWRLLRSARLAALSESPRSFLSTYEREQMLQEEQWRGELARGSWLVCLRGGEVLAVLGATPEEDVATEDRYLSYLWVAPQARRNGIATRLVSRMLDRLRAEGVARAWLWVLSGNDAARNLYGRLGFHPSGDRQPLPHDPRRHEERFCLVL
jgi:ribosomal protein S18 acetylase RimI-like enzyme